MRKVAISIVAGLVLLVVCAYIAMRIPAVEAFVVRHAVAGIVDRPTPILADANALSVLLCGTGSPIADRHSAGPCALVAAGKRLYVVDVGIGSVQNMMLWHLPMQDVAGVLLTHFHSDHIPELGELRLQTWVAGRDHRLPVYGPPGVGQVVDGFEQAYALDTRYRTEHHGADFLPPAAAPMEAHPIPIPADRTKALVLDQDGLKITAIRVNHGPVKPAYGYRFDYRGRSIVISGDTAPDGDLAVAARGADLLVHEGLQPRMVGMIGDALRAAGRFRAARIMHDIPGYHTSPVDAARIANEAGVKRLIFTHIIPPLPNSTARRMYLDGVSRVRDHGVELGHDGLLVTLPSGGDAIVERTLKD
ncbi:MAG TPA: MBL fold metallo-hydrolase [Pseudomonadales bacterium]|nr:MBL fold metallo-hydrolase [Pseudomonadales bacterium]